MPDARTDVQGPAGSARSGDTAVADVGTGGTAGVGDGRGDGPGGPLGDEIAGLDALELGGATTTSRPQRLWSSTWPKLAALVLGIAIWQAVVWSGWKDEFLLPPPADVLSELGDMAGDGTLGEALANTLRLAVQGFALSVLIGTVIGALVARVRILRAAFGSLITGIQTMPSVAWVPWAILLFRQTDATVLFVIVLGTVPAVANGLIAGADHIPPILLRAGRVLGARGFAAYRHVILPASLPGFVTGLKQGWAFAWRSLMAGEIIVTIAGEPNVGFLLQTNRTLSRADGVLAVMLVILAVGIIVDAVVFSTLERLVARRWGLTESGR
jgi:NitT/TauT family transport system permease protein